MEKRIERLRRVSAEFRALYRIILFFMALGVLGSVIGLLGPSRWVIIGTTISSLILTGLFLFLPVYTISLVLDFLADMGEKQLEIELNLQDMRQRLADQNNPTERPTASAAHNSPARTSTNPLLRR